MVFECEAELVEAESLQLRRSSEDQRPAGLARLGQRCGRRGDVRPLIVRDYFLLYGWKEKSSEVIF